MISPASGLRLLIAAASVILGFSPAASVSASQPQFVGTGPLSCGDWSAIIAAGPGERRETSMVYDPVRNRMLMFCGFRINTGAFNEVWTLSLSSMTWSLVTTVGTPPTPRASASAVYDPVRDRLIVYGGDEYVDGPPLGDVWSLSLSATPTWSPLATSATPPVARRFSSMIYDPVRDRLVILGGVLGREVKTLVDEAKSAGRYSATWEGRTSAGRLASGMYFVRLIAPDCTHVGRIALAR